MSAWATACEAILPTRTSGRGCPPYLRGLIQRAPIITATANTAGMTASHMPAARSAAVAAQLIDANASANVARRDEVWRRRKWLRFACARNQSWIAVADPAATRTPADR